MSKLIYTQEQLDVINTIMQVPQIPQININAYAGSAKSTTIHAAVHKLLERNPSTKIKVLVYGKANAEDAKKSLPKQVDISTVHAMAYQYTVEPMGLKLPIRDHILARDLPSNLAIDHDNLHAILELAELFLSSDFTSVHNLVETNLLEYTEQTIQDTLTVLNAMARGRINITHNFYLKLFHIEVLADRIVIDPVDVLILEEAQDLTQIMIDITDKYITSQRIFIGDSYQSILQFAGSIDVLGRNAASSTNLQLTKSFRVNVEDARVVQHFMREQIDESFVFEGFDKPEPEVVTKAYITRTNAALIDKMIELERTGTPFKLSTKTKLAQLFNLPLTLATLKPGGTQLKQEMQYLQDTADHYYGSTQLMTEYPTLFGYLRYKYATNGTIIQALDLVSKHGAKVLFGIYKSAKVHMKAKCDYVVQTAHTSKGSTSTEVELDPSMDKAITEVLKKPVNERTADDIAEIYLFYVSISRHTHKLTGSDVFEYIRQQLKEL